MEHATVHVGLQCYLTVTTSNISSLNKDSLPEKRAQVLVLILITQVIWMFTYHIITTSCAFQVY